MELLTEEIRKQLPPLGAQEFAGLDAVVYVKFFDPCGSWTWYVTEYDPETQQCFGMVNGFEEELGYFSLKELESAKGALNLGIERDLYWKPRPLRECYQASKPAEAIAQEPLDTGETYNGIALPPFNPR